MKNTFLALVALTLTACFEIPEIRINCTGGGNTLICSWFGTDAGAADAGSTNDAGMDASAQDASAQDASAPDAGDAATDASIADAGRDSGQDTGIPVVDSGQVVDSGTPVVVPATGVFKVVGSKLFDPNGVEFRMRGTSKTHQDNQSPGLGKTKSNTTRWLVYFTEDPDRVIRDLQSPSIGGSIASHAVAVPGFWDGTCKSDSASFNTMVNRWVRDAAKYNLLKSKAILNVANEWGDNETAWRDAYVAAIPRIRAAGWQGAIMVDFPGCGQNAMAGVRHGAAVLNADPQKNVIFSWHIYGNVYDSQAGIGRQWQEQIDLVPTFDALKASGLAVVVGEFGPGRNVGPSPTNITPSRVIDQAEAHGMGWLSWSWDDNNLANGMSNDDSFSHSYTGDYNSASDLTDFGKIVVGYWDRLAVRASNL